MTVVKKERDYVDAVVDYNVAGITVEQNLLIGRQP